VREDDTLKQQEKISTLKVKADQLHQQVTCLTPSNYIMNVKYVLLGLNFVKFIKENFFSYL